MATLHPAALLRIPDDDARATALAEFEADMQQAAALATHRRHESHAHA